jgi:hypothetical protein
LAGHLAFAAATLTVRTGSGRLRLPHRPPRAGDGDLPDLPPAESAPLDPRTTLRPAAPPRLELRRDCRDGTVEIVKSTDGGRFRHDGTGWEYGSKTHRKMSIADCDPLSARVDNRATVEFGRADGPRIVIELATAMTADATDFQIEASLDAYEDEEPVHATSWSERIPRDLV